MDGEAKACCRGRTGGGKGKQEQDAEEDEQEEGGCACPPSSSGTWRSTVHGRHCPLPSHHLVDVNLYRLHLRLRLRLLVTVTSA